MKIVDESMSAFHPTGSALGGLPHLSYIARKPYPFGVEFKTAACGVTGCLLHLEIQKGNDAMRQAEHSEVYSVTSACTLRLSNAVVDGGQPALHCRKNCICGDSWFASVKTAEIIARSGHSFVGPVKTNYGGYPKNEMKSIMENWPPGSSICFEAYDPNGNKLGLTALGYKYRKTGSMQFIMTNDAGSTISGAPQ
jgi:Transposase IS4